ncbi:hypothetical protein K443DRAFT_138414 [Laccaria amethystina LaAM-08-1]|uniref:Uncharacterized protein n=1 Tax=Laccaria amethystina LaAM-08-1 TaxID=1095629 RepID=A0A0C9YIG0_9AGAR|nr:hypothetical protein K443DRAFT_138414 [Laccaria amethystina LaAM-08-1]
MMIDSGNQRVKTTNYDGEVWEFIRMFGCAWNKSSCTYRGDWGVEVNENKFI